MDPDGLTKHVEDICGSATFARSRHATRLLRYMCAAHLADRPTLLKEYDLGLDVFGRTADFDPKQDSIVRTEVTRLRSRLQKYYEAEGGQASVRLHIPRGSYEIQCIDVTPVSESRSGHEGPKRSWLVGPLPFVALIAVLAIAALASFAPRPGAEHLDLRKLTSGEFTDKNPMVSRKGDLVAFSSNRGGAGHEDIWLQPAKGGDPIRLTHGPADASLPHFSPDGSTIVFQFNGSAPGIYTVPVTGGTPRLIAARGNRPRFSNDGRFVAYEIGARGGGAQTAIWIVPASGGPPRELKAGFAPAMHPLWSPDDRHILIWGGKPIDWWAVPMGPGEPIRAHAYASLGQQGLNFGPATDWLDNQLYFRAGRGDAANVHAARISLTSFQLEGPARRVTFGSGHETSASVTSDRRVVFASNVVRSPLMMVAPRASGDATAVRVPGDRAETDSGGPSASADGRRLVYVHKTADGAEIRMMEAGENRVIARGARFGWTAALDGSGRRVAFWREDKSLVVQSVDTGEVLLECPECGEPQRFSANADALLTRRGEQLLLVHSRTGAYRVLVHGKLRANALAGISPDARYVAFSITGESGTSSVWLAPVHADRAAVREEWIAVPDSTSDSNPRWSADGRWLYYLSERDGHRCVWRLPLGANGRPAGPASAVAHFHDPRLVATYGWPVGNGLALGQDQLFLRVRSETASIWMSR